MPIIRVDEDGNNLEDLERRMAVQEELRKLNVVREIEAAKKDVSRKEIARSAAVWAAAGMCLATGLFYVHSPELGIFAGLWPVTFISILNLVDD